jgi:hypothetical protein
MSDPFNDKAYGVLLNQWIAEIHMHQDWVRRHRLDQAARQALKDASNRMVDAAIDFIMRHSQFAIRRLNALNDISLPNPFDETGEAHLRKRLEGTARTKDVQEWVAVMVANPILQAFREARAAYDFEFEKVQKYLQHKKKPKRSPRKLDPKTAEKRAQKEKQKKIDKIILADWLHETRENYQDYVDWKNEHLPEGWPKLDRRYVELAIGREKGRLKRVRKWPRK